MCRVCRADAHPVALAQEQQADVEGRQLARAAQDLGQERVEVEIGAQRVADQVSRGPDHPIELGVFAVEHHDGR